MRSARSKVAWYRRRALSTNATTAFNAASGAASAGTRPTRLPPHHRPTVANYRQDRLVPLLSHAHLPHARERDKSAEVGVTHQPTVCNPSTEGAFCRLAAELGQNNW